MDNRTHVREVHVGERFTIDIESNPTTGYRWYPLFDVYVLELISEDFTAAGTNLVGASGVQHFDFKAIRRGKTTIRMLYARSWDRHSQKENAFYVSIT